MVVLMGTVLRVVAKVAVKSGAVGQSEQHQKVLHAVCRAAGRHPTRGAAVPHTIEV